VRLFQLFVLVFDRSKIVWLNEVAVYLERVLSSENLLLSKEADSLVGSKFGQVAKA
jgi:hypothetical protein